LNILITPAGAFIGAAHHIDVVKFTERLLGDTAQLGNSANTAMIRHGSITAEGERSHIGKLDGILGAGGQRKSRQCK
jgi:hypothetical protein